MRIFSILTFLFLLTSCNQIEKRGYAFELSDYKLAQEGLSNKGTIIQIMGSPTFISEIDGKELWIYFSEDVRKFLFLKPTILKRKIVTISFDKSDIADKISSYDLKDKNDLKFSSKHTEVYTPNKGFWSKVFGNIGQVSAN